jgi:hypothetical protein
MPATMRTHRAHGALLQNSSRVGAGHARDSRHRRALLL